MSFLYTEDSGPKSSCFLFEKQHDVNNNQIELKTQRILNQPIETNYIPSSDELDEVN